MRGRRIWKLLGVSLILGSCTYWEPYPVTTARVSDLPSSLRAASDTGAAILLVGPYVRADTLFGLTGRDTVGIPLSNIRELQRQRMHGLKTLGLTVGVIAAWIAVGLYGGGLE
jgi:hypothetical protein